MDPKRFSLAASTVAGHPGWLQPQGTYLGQRRAKESFLRSPKVLSRVSDANWHAFPVAPCSGSELSTSWAHGEYARGAQTIGRKQRRVTTSRDRISQT